MVSIFHFLPNPEALGAHSLTSKLTIGRDSQSLQVVEELQAPRTSVVDLLLLTAIQEVSGFFLPACIKITSFGNFTLKFFFREISPLFPKKFPNNSRVPIVHHFVTRFLN